MNSKETLAAAPQNTPEIQENRVGFLTRMRKELKLTFTLPKPGEGLMKDLTLKGLGAANIVLMNTWLRGADYMPSQDSRDSFLGVSDERFMTDVAPTVFTVIGAGAIVLANLVRYQPNASHPKPKK